MGTFLASSATALVVSETAKKNDDFAGAGCGSRDAVTLRLPRDATRIQPREPQVGTVFSDFTWGTPVARLIAVEIAADGNSVSFIAEGSADTCTDPSVYDGIGWETDFLRFQVDYKAKEKLFVRFAPRRQYRPRTLFMGANGRIKDLHWRGWNQRRARSRGVLPFNNCKPYCAVGKIINYPVKVKVSRPRDCGKRWQYLKLSYRFLGKTPLGNRKETIKGGCDFFPRAPLEEAR
ncbi:MAG: hypothetical protein ACRDMA_12775 [Solirubrobacterales bacterium]